MENGVKEKLEEFDRKSEEIKKEFAQKAKEENRNFEPTGLVIGLALRGTNVTPQWAISFAQQNYPMNCNRSIVGVWGNPVDIARNKIARYAVQNKSKYIWFLDDDVAPPFFAARRLIYALEMADDDVMIAGGVYASKTHPPEPVLFRGNGHGPFWRWKKGEIFEVTGIGTGCMMIKTELFNLLPAPETIKFTSPNGKAEDIPMWFRTNDIGALEGTVNGMGFNSNENGSIASWQTDDLYFCNQVIEAGHKIIADGSVLCIHWDTSTNPAVPYMLPEDSYPMRDEIAKGQIAT